MAGVSLAYQGIAGRYAKALFELADERKSLEPVSASLNDLKASLSNSPEFSGFLTNPLASREEAVSTVNAISAKMKLDELVKRTLELLATKRRLALLPNIIDLFADMLSKARGEVIAEVISAEPLTKSQLAQIEKALKQSTGKALNLKIKENPALLGGLIVKIGGKMLDYSLAGQMERLRTAMTANTIK